MSFTTDFSAITGSLTSTFTSVWNTVNPPRVNAPAPVPGNTAANPGTGVGSALQRAASSTDAPTMMAYILGGAGVIVLLIALVLTRKR